MKPKYGSAPKKSFSNLSDLIKNQLDKLTDNRFTPSISLQKKWPSLVGHSIAAHSNVLYAKENKLYVAVDSSTWLNELSFMKIEILRRIKETDPISKIDELIFKVRTKT